MPTTILLSIVLLISSLFTTPRAQHQIQVTGTLQTALNAALPGDVLLLEARAYNEPHVQTAMAGAAGAPIVVRGAGAAASTLIGRITLNPGAAFIALEDFGIDMAGVSGTNDALRIGVGVHDVSVRGMHLRNGGTFGMRIENDARDITVESSEIDHFISPGVDAHGIGIQTAQRITVRRCHIHDNSDDGVQTNTPDFPGYGRWASEILIEYNRIEHNGENGIDIKSTHGLTARYNRIAGYRAAGGGEGIALEVQYDAQDIVIEGNDISDAAMGIEVTRGLKRGADYPIPPTRVQIRANLIHDLIFDAFTNAGNGTGIVIRESAQVRVYNNTVLRAPVAALYSGKGNTNTFVQGLDARNNVFDGAQNDVNYNNELDALPGVMFSHNHFMRGMVRGKPIASWVGALRDDAISVGDPGLDAQGRPVAGSPLIDSGVMVGLPFAGAAPDRGYAELADPAAIPTRPPPATPDPRLTLRVYVPLARR